MPWGTSFLGVDVWGREELFGTVGTPAVRRRLGALVIVDILSHFMRTTEACCVREGFHHILLLFLGNARLLECWRGCITSAPRISAWRTEGVCKGGGGWARARRDVIALLQRRLIFRRESYLPHVSGRMGNALDTLPLGVKNARPTALDSVRRRLSSHGP